MPAPLRDRRAGYQLYFGSLCERKCVVNIDAKVPNRALDLCVTQQNLNCPEVAGGFVNDRRLCTPQRMRAVIFSAQTNADHPFIDQSGILASADVV